MKNRSVQAISIGLSAISLTAPASVAVYAQAAEVEIDAETATEQQVISDSGEKAIAEEVSNLSEQLNTATSTDQLSEAAAAPGADGQFDQHVSDVLNDAATAKEAVGSVSASLDNVVKADVAIGEAKTQAEDAVSQVDGAFKSVGEATSVASSQADTAVSAVKDENITEEDAATIIADTDKTIGEAQVAFDEAETKYNEAVTAYNAAKDDFNTALEAYNANKAEASGRLNEAETALGCAQAHLADIEAQLEAARNELAEAGADVLVAADTYATVASEEEKFEFAAEYAQKVLQYYYIPKVENLSDGQTIQNYRTVPVTRDGSVIGVFYDVVDSDGNVTRSVKAAYGYTIEGQERQLRLFEVKQQVTQPVNSVKSPKSVKSGGANNVQATPSFGLKNGGFEERYINVGDEVWMEMVTDYVSYVSSVRAKIVAYTNLLVSVENAKADFKDAQDKVASIKSQLEALNGATDIVSVAEMARLEVLLESAQADYSDAKENLEIAKSSLSDAKNIFNSKFPKAPEQASGSGKFSAENGQSQGSTSSVAYANEKQVQILEEKVENELEELEKIPQEDDETLKHPNMAYAGNSVIDDITSEANDGGSAGTSSKEETILPQDFPVVPDQVVTIEEEETPLAITLAGLMQHVKWFAGLGCVTVAGAGVSIFEVKRRAAAKIMDKLNQ